MKNENISIDATVLSIQKGKERDYWLNRFSDAPEKVSFPYDTPGDVSSGFRAAKLEFQWTGELFEKLLTVMKGSDYKLYMILMAGLVLLLKKYTGQDDITVGSPVLKQELEVKFINTTLALRNPIDPAMTFKDFLLQVRQTIIEGTEHQNYPVKSLLNLLNLTNADGEDGVGFPLFDTIILSTDIHDKSYIRDFCVGTVFTFSRANSYINGELAYNALRYNQTAMETLAAHYAFLLADALDHPGKKLGTIEILGEVEKKQLLLEFNDTSLEFPPGRTQTIGEIFADQAEKTPHQLAAVYEETQITYGELQQRSNQLAGLLREKGARRGDIVGLMVDRSLEMLIGILGILNAGGAYLPLDSEYPGDRNLFLLKDSGTRLLLWQKNFVENHHDIPAYFPGEHLIFLEDPAVYQGQETHLAINNCPGDPAYVIYTSGTSGTPKGVMVEHHNLLNLVYGLEKRIYHHHERSLHVCMVSPYVFDASVKQVFAALLLGHTLHVVSQQTRADAPRLIEYYFKHRIDISDGTPTHISLLWENLQGSRFVGESAAGFPVKRFIIGGEALSKQVVEQFLSLFGANPPAITNIYGPTECTVDAAVFEVSPQNLQLYRGIPIGKPMPNFQIFILAKDDLLQPVGISGELCIGGNGVSRGYLNRPELTAEKFKVNRSYRTYKSNILYQTGDLARWLPGGCLEYLGRIDRQVKIRGFRVELGEIESVLLKHEAVKAVVVTVREDREKDSVLCAYIVSASLPSPNELRDFLVMRLPYYLIPQYFIPIEKIPLTGNGKIDRKALPEPQPDFGDVYTVPRGETEKKLTRIWSEILGIEENIIGRDANFFRLGGHSLNATVLISRIHQELEVKLPLMEIFNNPSIKELAVYLETTSGNKFISIPPAEKKDYYPLTSSQKRMFVVQQMETGSKSYNTPSVSLVEGEVEPQRIRETFINLIERHESLRTFFTVMETEPVQRIAEEVDFEIINREHRGTIGKQEMHELIKSFIQPFDLSRAPLLRVGLIKRSASEYILIADMHHIIGDVVSYFILVNDFIRLYNGRTLPPLRIQYKDYSEWQLQGWKSGGIKEQEAYWLNRFRGDIPRLNLPTDYPRPKVRRIDQGDSLGFLLEEKLTAKIEAVVERTGVTVFMMLLAVFNIFLARYTKQEDIVVGTPVASRKHADLQEIIGVFLNMMALRNHPRGDQTFSQFLNEVRKNALQDYENQDYPFDELVIKLGLQGDTSRNPLFDVEFAIINVEPGSYKEQIQGLTIRPHSNIQEFAKFDLHFQVTESMGRMHFLVRYSTQLFKKNTIEKMRKYYLEILEQVTDDIEIKLEDIKLSHDFLVVKPRDYNDEQGGFKL